MFNPEKFLEMATFLKDQEDADSECRFRTSIGRAYYAAFLLVRHQLILKGYSFGNDAQHSDVRKYLKERGNDRLANELETLFGVRVDSDYELRKRIEKNHCENCIMISQGIIESIDDI